MPRLLRIVFITFDVIAVVFLEVLRGEYPEIPAASDWTYRIIAGHLVLTAIGPDLSEKLLMYIIDKVGSKLQNISFTIGKTSKGK